jgi:aspartate-semialdehyde dehydrogenase
VPPRGRQAAAQYGRRHYEPCDKPNPLEAAGDPVFVGRVRRDPTVEHGLALFVVGRQSLNAVQIAEVLCGRT